MKKENGRRGLQVLRWSETRIEKLEISIPQVFPQETRKQRKTSRKCMHPLTNQKTNT